MKKNRKKVNTYEVDARGKSLGRLATEVVILLRGKNKASFQPNALPSHNVIITNLKDVRVSGKKLEQKKYFRFSGYPGGIKCNYLKDLILRNPEKLIRQVIYNMLPKNKLRSKLMNKIKVK